MDAIIRRARPGLGTLIEMRIEGLREAQALAAIDAAFAEVAAVHRTMSFHEAGSDLARLHCVRPGEPVAIDPRTAEVLRCALEIADLSAGAFDPTLAARAVVRGLLPRPDPSYAPDPLASWRDIELLDAQQVRLRCPLWIDLGGIAKGYAVDRAVDILVRAGAKQACVNAGGDLRIAGAREEAVQLRIEPGARAYIVALRNGALASSAAASLLPHDAFDERARATAGISVAAPSCMHADALTKVALAAPAPIASAALARFDAQAFVHARAVAPIVERAA